MRNDRKSGFGIVGPALALAFHSPTVWAQRANENAVASASDAFGVTVGDEQIGVYSTDNVRGFSPITAGNRRLEGLYIDTVNAALTRRLVSGSSVRVGLPALVYPFAAPSGIIDYRLRPAGDEFVASVVVGRPYYKGGYVEVDAQIPVLPHKLAVAVGAGYTHNDYADGRATQEFTAAVIPGLRFGGGALTAFWTFAENRGDTGALMVTLGPFLPPDFKPGRFKGQGWADRLQRTHHYGLIGHIDIAPDWRLSGGAFETRSTRRRSYVDLFLDVAPDGSAQNIMIAEPPLPARWTSGEAQIIWSPKSDALAHQFTMSLRVRDKKLEQGGGGSALLGPARIGVANPARQPNFTFQPTTSNSVTQWSPGIAYIGRWRRLAEVNASVQKSSYRQTVSRNGISARTDADALLYNIAVALQPTSWLTVYGGHVKGLEETAAPPQFASNRDDTPPASQTRQWDAGIRLSFGDTRLVAGVFETTRPYFATNSANFYTRLGERRNRGVELSVVAQPLNGLRVVGGLIYYDPQVVGSPTTLGRTGRRPLGSTAINARLDLDYDVAQIDGLSLQMTAAYTGRVIASTEGYAELDGGQLRVPAAATLDVGVRYRWQMGDVPVAARLSLQDITDERILQVSGSNGFSLRSSRRMSLQLSADF